MSGTMIKNIVISAVLLILVATVAVLAVKLNENVTTKTIGASAFRVGGLDEDGFEVKDETTIVTKEYVTADGLKIEVNGNKVQYKIAFYDKHHKLVGEITEYTSEDYEANGLDASVAFAKIVVEPLNDEEITRLEVRKYAKQITVTVNR